MPRPYPRELRDDVVAVARRGEAPIRVIAKDFGLAESCVRNWMRAADLEHGVGSGRAATPAVESEQVRELKLRNRLLEQEVEVLRRGGGLPVPGASTGKMIYPLVNELAGGGIPVAVTCGVLKLSRQPYYSGLTRATFAGWLRLRVADL